MLKHTVSPRNLKMNTFYRFKLILNCVTWLYIRTHLLSRESVMNDKILHRDQASKELELA